VRYVSEKSQAPARGPNSRIALCEGGRSVARGPPQHTPQMAHPRSWRPLRRSDIGDVAAESDVREYDGIWSYGTSSIAPTDRAYPLPTMRLHRLTIFGYPVTCHENVGSNNQLAPTGNQTMPDDQPLSEVVIPPPAVPPPDTKNPKQAPPGFGIASSRGERSRSQSLQYSPASRPQ
jgi:hypothetical protein